MGAARERRGQDCSLVAAGPERPARLPLPDPQRQFAVGNRRFVALLIDPDAIRRRGVLKCTSTYALGARGAGSPKRARAWLEREHFDAVLLHDAFPDTEGEALLRWLRKSWPGPILPVTVRGQGCRIAAAADAPA